jgi:DNA-directed RNA polymerase subunit RPC12/RpoP
MDAFIRFNCPDCGKRRKASPDAAGKRARCSCGCKLVVPGQVIVYDEVEAAGGSEFDFASGDLSRPAASQRGRKADDSVMWYGVCAVVTVVATAVAIVAFVRADRETQNGVVAITVLAGVLALAATLVAAVKQCSWVEGLGYTLSGIAVAVVFLGAVFVAAAAANARSPQASGGTVACRRCGAVVDRSRVWGMSCPVCGSLL